MNRIKQIAVFTSIRSEYGLLKSLIKNINEDYNFELRLLVAGAHLLADYGNTIDEITADGFKITATFPFLFNDNQPDVLTRSIGVLAAQISTYLATNKPDLLFVLGDRFELLPVVNTALILNVPVAHISGGETTEGAIDNQVRHAISKMANLHFVATDEFKKNLISMGEEDWRICVCGELGLNEIEKMQFTSKTDLYKDLGLDESMPVILATFHPETLNYGITPDFVSNLYKKIINTNKVQILATASNFDEGGNNINIALEKLSDEEPNLIFVKNLGKQRYFSLLKYCALVLGNSSSGLVEVQSFNIPAINVGDRQKGRLANPNVINAAVNEDEIVKSIDIALSNGFKEIYYNKPNLYSKGDSVNTIMSFINVVDVNKLLVKKNVFN